MTPALLQRRPGEAAAIAVRPDRCERCEFWKLREAVLAPLVRGDCARIVSVDHTDLTEGPYMVGTIGLALVTPPTFSCSLFVKRKANVTDAHLRAAELLATFRHDPPWDGYIELLTSPVQFRIYSKHAIASLKPEDHPDTRDSVRQAAALLDEFHKRNPQ